MVNDTLACTSCLDMKCWLGSKTNIYHNRKQLLIKNNKCNHFTWLLSGASVLVLPSVFQHCLLMRVIFFLSIWGLDIFSVFPWCFCECSTVFVVLLSNTLTPCLRKQTCLAYITLHSLGLWGLSSFKSEKWLHAADTPAGQHITRAQSADASAFYKFC